MNTSDLPQDVAGLSATIFLMGVRHGLDADHLAAIDGLTRFNALARPRLARLAGVLFSAGHGVVVVAVAVGVCVAARRWQVPDWLDAFGAWVSIGVLTALAVLNGVAVLRLCARVDADASPTLPGATFARVLRTARPAVVVGAGALFALSFDTLSQATLFAMAASSLGGWGPALELATLFALGMLLVDGFNGAWIARLIRRSDRSARRASRLLTLSVSGVGLATATLTLASRFLPEVDAWLRRGELWFGLAVGAVVGSAFVIGQRLVRAEARVPPT